MEGRLQTMPRRSTLKSGFQKFKVQTQSIQSDIENNTAPWEAYDATAWHVGSDCGPYVSAQRPLQLQAQVLLCNVAENVKALPQRLLQSAVSFFSLPKSKCSKAHAVAGKLLGLPCTVDALVRRLKRASWVPAERLTFAQKSQQRKQATASTDGAKTTASTDGANIEQEDPVSRNKKQMTILVRTALSNAAEGDSGCRYERDVARLRAHGLDIGDRFHSRHFLRECIHVAALTLQTLDAIDVHRPCEGLGIPSDLSIVMDPVSIGGGFPRHDTVLVMCLFLISAGTSKGYVPLLDAPTLPLGGHGGREMSELALKLD